MAPKDLGGEGENVGKIGDAGERERERESLCLWSVSGAAWSETWHVE